LKKQKELNISATTISKNTKLTEAGIQRILKGVSKNPQEDSLNQIIQFFEKEF
jgi:predicted transcriptional regulator